MNNNKFLNNIKKEFCLSNEIIEVFTGYLNSNKLNQTNKTILNDNQKLIYSILKNRKIESRKDFNDLTYITDTKRLLDQNYNSFNCINTLYSYLLEKNYGVFELISDTILNFHGISKLVLDGYELYRFNPFSKIPNTDKWIIENDYKIYKFDFSLLNNELKKEYLKSFIWNYPNLSFKIKSKRLNDFISVLNDLNLEKNKLKIETSDIIKIRKQFTENKESSSGFVLLNPIKSLIKYLDKKEYLIINQAQYDLFKVRHVNSKGNCIAYTEEEINKILKSLLKESEENEENKNLYLIMYYIVRLLESTSMRLETLLELNINSIYESKPGSYYVLASSKKVKFDKYNLTKKTKSYLDKVFEITNIYRNNKNNINNYIFIYKSRNGNTIKRINRNKVQDVLLKVFEKYNIRNLGITGLRNRFMQDITKYVSDTGADTNLISTLSKHSYHVHYSHYYDENIENYALDLYGVNIGDLDLNGKVLKNTNLKSSSVVQNGCGNCSLENCSDFTVLDCLMCKHFITTPDNIPYFQNEIEIINNKIVNEEIAHEKEFLISKKRLLVKYLTECIGICKKGDELNA